MKPIACVLLFISLSGLCGKISAKKPDNEIFIGTAGWYSLGIAKDIDFKGFGGDVKIGYNFFLSDPLSLSVGLGVAHCFSSIGPTAYSISYPIQNIGYLNDSRFIFNADYKNYKETDKINYLNIPVMLNFYFPYNMKYYASLGLKLNIPLSGNYEASADILETHGYSTFIGNEHYNEQEYGFYQQKGYIYSDNDVLKTGAMFSLALGKVWDLGKNDDKYACDWHKKRIIGHRIYLGIFCDYTFIDMQKKTSENVINYQTYNPSQLVYNSLANANSINIVRFNFGLSLNIAFY